MDKIDTSTAAVSELAVNMPDTQWMAPRLYMARDTLIALAAERDAAIARAEQAEVETALITALVNGLEVAKSHANNELIDRLIRIKDQLSSKSDRDAINDACAALAGEGGE